MIIIMDKRTKYQVNVRVNQNEKHFTRNILIITLIAVIFGFARKFIGLKLRQALVYILSCSFQ